MKRNWTKLSEKEVYSTPFFSVKEKKFSDTIGYEDDFYSFTFTDWVHVVPILPDGRIMMIKQYRFGIEDFTLEFPGGQVKSGDSPLKTATIELMEETGYSCPNIIELGFNYPNPATHENKCWFYLAKDCVLSGETNFDPAEEIEISYISKEELLSSHDKLIKHSLAQVAFYKAKEYF